MFYYISGKLAVCQPNLAVIDCGGVGFKCSITMNTYKAISGKDSVKLCMVTVLEANRGLVSSLLLMKFTACPK